METFIKKIDLKSFITGFLFCVVVILLLSAVSSQSNSTFRYQISSGYNHSAYVIDTKTGAVTYIGSQTYSGEEIRSRLNQD